MFFIGIDPHKGSHSRGRSTPRTTREQVRVRADRPQRDRAAGVRGAVRTAVLGDRRRAGVGALLAQQLVAAGEPCSTCRRRSRPGCGCSTPRAATRPTRTMPAPPRSSRCGTRNCGSCGSRTTPRCCACSRNVTTTWSRIAPARSVASTRCSCQLRRRWPPQTLFCRSGRAELRRIRPADAVGIERRRLAVELLGEVRRADTDLAQLKKPASPIGRRVNGDQRHRRVRCRPDHGRVSHRLQRRRPSLPERRALRPLQRHRADRSVVGTEPAASTQPPREPPVEPRAPHRRGHPGPQRHPGRAYYLRKQAEGKTRKEALRALKRRISDAVYHQLLADTTH